MRSNFPLQITASKVVPIIATCSVLGFALACGASRNECSASDLSCNPLAILLYSRQVYPRSLYAVANTPGTLYTYSIDRDTGLLKLIDSRNTGTTPYDIAANPAGTALVATDLTTSQFLSFTVDPGTGLITNTNSPITGLSSPVGATFDPTGNFAYAINNSAPNNVNMFRANQSNGSLSSLSPATVGMPATGRLISFDPLNRFAYVGNQTSPAMVSQYTVSSTGVLVANGSVTLPGNIAYGLAVHP